ncbi:type II secretion system F family protein [Desulfogranum japonicum]|uniref:type II secretion system F family protein n=1 Tax=Desulfogranum japonicum TaxID=231447 RepID=UPI0003FFEB8E|nr:type II secretion system F family protein [Desulfogranum japonicum]
MRQKQQRIILYRQFAALLSRETPLEEIVAIIGEESDGSRLQDTMVALNADLQQGVAMWEGMGRHPEIFPPVLVEGIQGGLSGKSLARLFLALAKDLDESGTMRKRLRRSLSYPFCIIFLALALIALMVTFVLPVFAEMYDGFGATLPLPTQILISLASAFYGHGLLAIFLLLTLVLLFLFLGNRVLSWSSQVPGLRKLTKTIFLCRLSLYMAALSGEESSPATMLRMAAGPLFPSSWKTMLEDATERAGTTDSGLQILRRTNIFPPFYLQMVRVAERGTIGPAVYADLASYYEEEFQRIERRLVLVFDIVAICAAALLVTLFVFALYLPLFKLAEVI